jgi:hypothetical protein
MEIALRGSYLELTRQRKYSPTSEATQRATGPILVLLNVIQRKGLEAIL